MTKPITDGQIISLKSALREVGAKDDNCILWMINQYLNSAYDSLNALNYSDWVSIRNRFYPNWALEDWTLDMEQRRKLAELYQRYKEEVTGQMRLF